MYYRLKYGKNYLLKIIVLVLAAVLGELIIWWAMVREESVEWISGRILHQPYAYAITELEDGRVVVGNVIKGFEITLPAGWRTEKLRYPGFYFDRGGELVCEVKSNIVEYKEKINIAKLLNKQEKFIKTSAGITPAIKKEQTTDQGNFIYELQIPLSSSVIQYTLFASQNNKTKCRNYFEQIRKSFIYY